MDEDFRFFVTAAAVTITLVASIIWLGFKLAEWECAGKTRDIGYSSRFEIFGGCQIQKDSRWIPLSNFREF